MKNNQDELTNEAKQKMMELLSCGNERVELAAAKEIVSMLDKTDDGDKDISLEVTIKIV